MFDFKNGMLGVVIVAVAIAGAIFGSYLAGIDSEQVEVTKYSYLADVSGLFDYNQSPQYIEFDPSTNYTGYYSDNSYNERLDKYFFAEDEVDFKPNDSVNNYKVELPAIAGTSSTMQLTTTDVTKPFSDPTNVGLVNTYGNFYSRNCDTISLKSWMETTGLMEEGNLFYFKSIADYTEFDAPDFETENVNWVLFSTTNMWIRSGSGISGYEMMLGVGSEEEFEEAEWEEGQTYQDLPRYRMYNSVIVNTKTNTVTLCYDSNCEEPGLMNRDLNSVLVSFNGTYRFDMTENIDVEVFTMRYTYLDPNEGVWMKESA